METRTLIRSCIVVKDPEYIEEIKNFKELHNIEPKPYPDDIISIQQEVFKIEVQILDLILCADILLSDRIDLLDVIEAKRYSHSENPLLYFRLLLKYLPGFWANLYLISKKWFPSYPVPFMVNIYDPIQRFMLRNIFFELKDLTELHYANFYHCSSGDMHRNLPLIELYYAKQILSELNIDLLEYMREHDSMLYEILEIHYCDLGRHPKLMIELFPGIKKKEILDNWDNIQTLIEMNYEHDSKPRNWRNYVELFSEYQFNKSTLKDICKKCTTYTDTEDENQEEKKMNQDTLYKAIKRIAELGGYELREPRKRGKK